MGDIAARSGCGPLEGALWIEYHCNRRGCVLVGGLRVESDVQILNRERASAVDQDVVACATSVAIILAAVAGSSAAVTARPITSMSAPRWMASAGVATRP
jgi:hypothetical protein